MHKIKILFSEGSSLSARHALNAIGPLGYIIDICDSDPLCICRFSRYVRRFHRCPPFAHEPAAYLDYLLGLLQHEQYDVLLPVHDQAYLFARARRELSRYSSLAVSDFESFKQLQSKTAFTKLLDDLHIPHPPSHFVHSPRELAETTKFPCYVKLPFGTAGRGTWRVEERRQLEALQVQLEREGVFDAGDELLVQQAATGQLCVVQSIFSHGRLMGAHAYRLCKEGVGGSASARVSVHHPRVFENLEAIGRHLDWHGCLMLDYLYDDKQQRHSFIEANPRPGETMNATFSGVNLIELLVRLSLEGILEKTVTSVTGTRTHSLLAVLLGLAYRGAGRGRLLAELADAVLKRGFYASSREDVTPIQQDLPALLPLSVVAARLLLRPASFAAISGNTVSHYALTPETARYIENNMP